MPRIPILTFILMIGICAHAEAGPIGYSVRAHTGDALYAIDLSTGIGTNLGRLVFGDAEGIAIVGGSLYSIGGGVEELWYIATPPGAKIADTGPRLGGDAGLAEDVSGGLYNLQGDLNGTSHLYRIDPLTGSAAFIGSSNTYADGLAIDSAGRAFAVDGIFTDSLYSVDLTTGGLTNVGSLGLGNTTFHTGLSFDDTGNLWMISHVSHTYTIDTATGLATQIARVTSDGFFINGFMGLAIDTSAVETHATAPEPGTLTLLTIGAALTALRGRRRRASIRRSDGCTLHN